MNNKTQLSLKKHLSNENVKSQLALALPSHMTEEKFTRVAITALSRNPDLQRCDPNSFMMCLLDMASMGLFPDGRTAHLLPFRNGKKGTTECQLIIDYKGLVELMRRSGDVTSIHADVVCENDEFIHNMGVIESHTFDLRKPRGKMYAVYAQVTLKDGSKQSAIMSKQEVEAIKGRSKSGGSSYSPWSTDYNEMAKKTAIRRLSKFLTLSTEIHENMTRDDRDFEPTRNVTPPKEEPVNLPPSPENHPAIGAVTSDETPQGQAADKTHPVVAANTPAPKQPQLV